jgi:hypothetical protein
MALPDIDALTQLAFSVSENKGVFAVLVGSGLSRAAYIPTGWEITLDLIRRVATAQGCDDEPDWAKWFTDKTGETPDYSKLLEALATTPAERRAILHAYIEPSEADRGFGRKTPTPAHYAIADMVVSGHIRVIITTNFDRLMETALRERGIEPTVVSSVDALRGAEPLTHSKCYILKVHGDYKDARILNTDSELSKYPEEFNALLDRIFDEHGLIICGWSGEWDEALRRAMIRAPNRRYPIYWATRSELQGKAVELAQHRGGKIIRIADANTFFRDLRDRVETLEKMRRVNPRSVELAVASAKRFLARPEYRIELDQLISDEADLLSRLFDDERLRAQGGWSDEEFRERVKRYEAATETLARIAGVLGRWGDGSELALISDLVRSHYTRANSEGNGLIAWLSLRSYPALLIATAYGLGMARAQRWHDMHKFFRHQMPREERQPVMLVEALTPGAWRGNANDFWRHLDGLENRKTALSDHLVALFTEWGKSFAGLIDDFELLFDRFEILASLAYLEQHTLAELQQAKSGQQTPQQFAPSLAGRFGWRRSSYETVTQEMQNETMKPKLLDAGFARGSPDFLTLFIENLAFVVSRMRW